MIVFHNPGLIEVNSIRLMGASVKEEGSFGRFGTGLKYAIATVLRGGGQIQVYSGFDYYTFQVQPTQLKGQDFSEVVLVIHGEGEEIVQRMCLGFTTGLGKDWEPWMAAREFGCNARDEGGTFTIVEEGEWELTDFAWHYAGADEPLQAEDITRLVVIWPAMEEALQSDENHVFAPASEVLLEERGVRVLPGPSDYLYHRGVRVWKLPKPAVFTYDILAPVDLTEDRTVKYSFIQVAQVRNMILETADRGIIAGAVSAAEGTWEAGFDWSLAANWEPREPKEDWLEEVSRLREAKHRVSKSAVDTMLSHSAFTKAESYGGGLYNASTGAYADVVDQLESFGLPVKDLRVFVSEELPQGAFSAVRNGAVYIAKTTLEQSPYVMARELLKRRLEVLSGGDHDKLLTLVLPMILDRDADWCDEREELEKEGVS